MGLLNIYFVSFTIYLLIWFSLLIGIQFRKKDSDYAKRLNAVLTQGQVRKFKYPPFKYLLQIWIAHRYVLASMTFLIIIIVPASFFYFLLGLIFFSPVLALLQGFIVGNLIGKFGKKEMVWAVIVGIFEFGYWALSGALGITVVLESLSSVANSTGIFERAFEVLLSGLWKPLAICFVGNAFIETAGPIFWNINTPISLEDLK